MFFSLILGFSNSLNGSVLSVVQFRIFLVFFFFRSLIIAYICNGRVDLTLKVKHFVCLSDVTVDSPY